MKNFMEMLFGKRDSVETRSARKLRLESLEDRHLLDGAGLLTADFGAFDVAEAENVAPAIEQGIITVTLDDDGPIDHSDDFNADGSPNRITLREAFDYVGKFGDVTYSTDYYQTLRTHDQLTLSQAETLNYIRTIEISESVGTIVLDSEIVYVCDYFNDTEGDFDSTISVNGNSTTITCDGDRAFAFVGDQVNTNGWTHFPDDVYLGETGVVLNDLVFTGCGCSEDVERIYHANRDTGGYKVSSGYGGAVWAEGFRNFGINNCVFDNNIALDSGGAVFTYCSNFYVNDSVFSNNTAALGGGAILNDWNGLYNGCVFQNNGAVLDGGAVYCAGGWNTTTEWRSYGSIPSGSTTYYSFDDCVFEGNSAGWDGGAIYMPLSIASVPVLFYTEISVLTINDSAFNNNNASRNGGAVYARGQGDLDNVTFTGNTAGGNGGGCYLLGDSYSKGDNYWNLTECTFTENEAAQYGGAVDVQAKALLASACTFESNAATGNNGRAGAVNSSSDASDDECTFEYVNCVFENNSATEDGGAVESFGWHTFDGCTFTENEAGMFAGGISAWGRLDVEYSEFVENIAGECGGAIFSDYDGITTIENSNFDGNIAVYDGGALCFYTTAGTQTLKQNEFQNNVASKGGAIYLENASATSEDDRFYHNGASEDAEYGGAIYLQCGAIALTGDSFESNGYYESVGDEGKTGFCVRGGAIYNAADGEIVVDSVTFDSNYGYYGGAVYNKGVFEQSGGAFRNNEAYLGGAFYNHAQGVASLSGTSASMLDFESNVARFSDVDAETHGSGGAIYQSGSSTTQTPGSLLASNVHFYDNVASKYGGAIANYQVATASSDVTVADSFFEANAAAIGGALANAGDIVVDHSMFSYNNAYASGDSDRVGLDLYTLGGRGGAIYSANNATSGNVASLTLNGYFMFHTNTATVSGGALNIVSGEVNFGTDDDQDFQAEFMANTAYNGFGGAIVLANGLDNVKFATSQEQDRPFNFVWNYAWYGDTIAVNAKFGDDYKALVEAFGFDYSDLSLDQVATFTYYSNDLKDEILTFEYLEDFSAEHVSDYVTVRYVGETSTGEVTLSAGEEVTLRELGVPYDEAAGHCVSGSYKIEFYYGQAGEGAPDNLFGIVVGVTGEEDYMTIRRITMNGDYGGERQLMEGFSFITYDLPIETVRIDWGDGAGRTYWTVGSFSTNVYHMFPAKGEGAEDDTYSVVCDLKLVGSNKHIVVSFDYQAYGSLAHFVPGTIETYYDDAASAVFADEDLVADLFND